MESTNLILLIAAALLFVSVLATALSARIGVPVLLLFLTLGMLAGEDGPGAIHFQNVPLAFLIGNLALAIILLDGGMRTRIQTFRTGLRPALSLATVGVAVTAAMMGGFIAWKLDVDWRYGLLLGAIVGSTDAAAVFSALAHSGVALNERVGATLEIESGANDPMAVFLVVVLIEILQAGSTPELPHLLMRLAQQFGIGIGVGLVAAFLLEGLVERAGLNISLEPLLLASGGLLSFALINALGGSGFLGIYLMGVIIGNSRPLVTAQWLPMMGGYAWLSQAAMFLVLGLLVTPSTLGTHLLDALMIAFFLILCARPAAVALSLLPFRFAAREVTYIAWIGLRGAVPIVLSLFPTMAGLPGGRPLFDIAFVVVLTSLLVQGTTVAWLARLLNVNARPADLPRLPPAQ